MERKEILKLLNAHNDYILLIKYVAEKAPNIAGFLNNEKVLRALSFKYPNMYKIAKDFFIIKHTILKITIDGRFIAYV